MKKSAFKDEKKFDLSESQSKGFRTKTASVMKSIKISDDIRGSYSGIAHEASIDHLRQIGVTTIELSQELRGWPRINKYKRTIFTTAKA